MKTKIPLAAIAVTELVTGIGLLLFPSLIVQLLLGIALDIGEQIVVARVAGIALITIGLVCWLENAVIRDGAPIALLMGLLVYNGAIPALLIHSYTQGMNGVGLWPVVILHVMLTCWLGACLRAILSARRRPVQ